MDATPKLCCKHIIVKQKGSMLSQESDGGCHALEPKDQILIRNLKMPRNLHLRLNIKSMHINTSEENFMNLA